jgi:Xaa-Pro aminopeptidase
MSLDFKRRLAELQQRMMENAIDLVIYGSCQNFQYLTGFLLDWRRGTDLGSSVDNVFVPKEGQPVLTLNEEMSEQAQKTWIKDVVIVKTGENYGELVKRIISNSSSKMTKVGLGDHVWGSTLVQVARVLKSAGFCTAEALMDHVRMTKDLGEIERLKKVAGLTDKVVERVVPKIGQGVTQRELELEAESQGKLLGASDVSFPPTTGFVKSGSEVTRSPFTYPKEKGLDSQTSIAFDIGFVMDGYCSDFGRSFYFGPADTRVKKGYEALQQSVLETVDKMYDGSMRVCDVFPTIEKALNRLGYGDHLRARLKTRNVGHNIGVEVHEPPWLSPDYDEVLHENMVIALEPKLWHPGEYYLRVEDIVLVGKSKTTFLTSFDRELFQL